MLQRERTTIREWRRKKKERVYAMSGGRWKTAASPERCATSPVQSMSPVLCSPVQSVCDYVIAGRVESRVSGAECQRTAERSATATGREETVRRTLLRDDRSSGRDGAMEREYCLWASVASRAKRLLAGGGRGVGLDQRVGWSDAHLEIGLQRAAGAAGELGRHHNRRQVNAGVRVTARHGHAEAARALALRVGSERVGMRLLTARAHRRHALVQTVERLSVLEALNGGRLLHHQCVRSARAKSFAAARKNAQRKRPRRRQALQLQHTLALLPSQSHLQHTVQRIYIHTINVYTESVQTVDCKVNKFKFIINQCNPIVLAFNLMFQKQYLKMPNTRAILPIARILFLITSRRAALAAVPPASK